nr:hypothetical protein [uncultured Pseudodesulfovibrio sp.]
MLNSDAYTRTRKNIYTGNEDRQWLEYADGTLEPVQKNGNLNKKFHDNPQTLDWWTVDKPKDWDPVKEGKKVSLNHDYGQENNPKKKTKAPNSTRRTVEFRKGKDEFIPIPLPHRNGDNMTPQLYVKGKTALLQGAEAYHEFEAQRQAAKTETKKTSENEPEKPTKYVGADAVPRPTLQDDKDSTENPGAASTGVLGGMVQSNGQHGKGKLVSSDPKIQELIDEFGEDRNEFKKGAKGELKNLSKQAKQAKSPKERKKLLNRKDVIKGAIKLMDRYLLKVPLITPFSKDKLQKINRGYDPNSPTT